MIPEMNGDFCKDIEVLTKLVESGIVGFFEEDRYSNF